MQDTGDYFDGLKLYSCTYTDLWNGVDKMQFQLYDGETWKEQKQPYSSWASVGTYNGKVFKYETETWVDYVETTVHFVTQAGSLGNELNFNSANGQYEGVYTTTTDGEKFKIRKTVGTEDTDYAALDSYMSDEVATSDGTWVTIVKAGAYMVYFKGDNTMWIQDAEPSLVAYAYAGYFLTNVGCDPNGVAAPTGWSDCATRYSNLNDDAKNYIYNFDVSTAESGDDIAAMIARYEWAIKHNPNSLSHFIVNAGGTERPISSSNMVTVYKASSNNSNHIPVIAIVASSIAMVTLLGAGLMIKHRKEDR